MGKKPKELFCTPVELRKHCDDPECSLGIVIIECPSCSKKIKDSNTWFELPMISEGGSSHFPCPSCKENLMLIYNSRSDSFFVSSDVIICFEEGSETEFVMVIKNIEKNKS